jgi:hypothetical protein
MCYGADYAVAEPYGAPYNCVEDRLYIARGARNHAQDFAGRRLLLSRLDEFTGPAVQFFLQIGGRGSRPRAAVGSLRLLSFITFRLRVSIATPRATAPDQRAAMPPTQSA